MTGAQVMTSDVPYIDYFKVEMRWDVRGVPQQGGLGGSCSVSIMVDVPFMRKTVFRQVGLRAVVKPLLSHSATGEFNSPPKYLRTPKKRQT
eukprot:1408195-Pyramimonas_sp.AAC.1